jgi:hypothetical protein
MDGEGEKWTSKFNDLLSILREEDEGECSSTNGQKEGGWGTPQSQGRDKKGNAVYIGWEEIMGRAARKH